MNKITLDSPYVPWDQSNFTDIQIGSFTVRRRQMTHTLRTQYVIMDGQHIAGTQLSYPTFEDCKRHVADSLRGSKKMANGPVTSRSMSSYDTLAARVVVILKIRAMDEKEISDTMNCAGSMLRTVLGRLVKSMRVRRTGRLGAYVYSAK